MAHPLLRRRLYVAFALVVAGVAGWWAWSQRLVRDTTLSPPEPEPFVRVGAGPGSTDQLLREKADLLDPAPLFVPTARNYGQRGLPADMVKQPGGVFADFGPKLSFEGASLVRYATEDGDLETNLAEILARNNEAPFSGLGENSSLAPILNQRGAAILVKNLEQKEIRNIEVPPGVPPRGDFPPAEFLLVVGPAGLIGDPVIAVSSGFEEVDVFFLDFLVRTARLGAILAPGRYLVVVGP